MDKQKPPKPDAPDDGTLRPDFAGGGDEAVGRLHGGYDQDTITKAEAPGETGA